MKALLTCCVLLLLPLGILRGESEIRMRGIEDRVSSLENTKKALQPINPCAGPKVKGGMDINLSAAFIYWTMRLDGLTYAKTGFGDLPNLLNPKKGEVQSVDWSWDPGFKAALGWNFCHGCWDMVLQYTWLYTNVSDTKRSNHLQPGFEILGPSFQSLDLIELDKAHAHFDLHYQVGDLELGRNFYVSKTLKLRPFVGAKGTWQKQDYNVYYERIPFTIFGQNIVFDFQSHMDQALWGIGMRGGMNTSWHFSKVFSLYGNMAFTGIWLHYDNDRKDTFTVSDNQQQVGQERTTLNIQDHLRLIRPVFEFALGLRAETYYGCGRYHILLEAGWEAQIWPNQTMYISIDNNYDRYDLNMHGLTAKVRLDF